MKLVSRYLMRHLSRPWFYIIAGFSIIAILADLFSNFVDFMETGTPIPRVLLYYAIMLPTYLPYMLPISLLLALLYALWQLGKNSELTAMRASGLSITQLITPYLLTGLLASILLLGINELFNPWATQWTRQFNNMLGSRHAGQTYLALNLAYKNVPGRRIWRINTFDTRPSSSFEIRGINLTQQRPDGSDEFRLDAARGRWVDGHWWFESVETRYYDSNNDPTGPAEASPNLEMTMLAENPKDFLNEIKNSNERSAAEILQFIDTHQGISKETRNRLMVDFHYRLAAPWLCLIAILVGVPFGTHAERKGMGMGILLALLTFFSYYILMGLGLAYGKRQIVSPVLAGWLPNLVFFVLGLALLRRIR
jgi:lipopolysaccharide export system permease protein